VNPTGSEEVQISPLRYPGFPVELGDVGELHAVPACRDRRDDKGEGFHASQQLVGGTARHSEPISPTLGVSTF
jgi:hypothetical protein